MGIKGLLPLVPETLDKNGNLSEFNGKTLGVDAMGWLYKGAYSCALELLTGQPTEKLKSFCRRRLELLMEHGIKPLLVFDGRPLPAKSETDKERKKTREIAREKCRESLEAGDTKAAWKHAQSGISIPRSEVLGLQNLCNDLQVPLLVAPYESDAQLAYLERTGVIDGIITEDSDLIAYGCGTILYKLDKDGHVEVYYRNRLENEFRGWSARQFVEMCVLAGCDYCPRVAGVGAKTAFNLTNTFGGLAGALEQLRKTRPEMVPKGYETNALAAVHIFLHQRVFDPVTNTTIPLEPFGGDVAPETAKVLVGPDLEPDVAYAIAAGEVDPLTLLPNVMPQQNEPSEPEYQNYESPKVYRWANQKTKRESTRMEKNSVANPTLPEEISPDSPEHQGPHMDFPRKKRCRSSTGKNGKETKAKDPLSEIMNKMRPKKTSTASPFISPQLRQLLRTHHPSHTSTSTHIPSHRGVHKQTGNEATEKETRSTHKPNFLTKPALLEELRKCTGY